jgi:hypothetical protein
VIEASDADGNEAFTMTRISRRSPPTREESDRAVAVRIICDLLMQAAQGDHFALAMSTAMENVAGGRCIRHGPISAAQRDKLLIAVVRAHAFANDYLLRWFTPWQIDCGMQALAGQVMLLAESREQAAARDPGRVSDIHDYARVFRNYMHNLSLAQEIESRAHNRRRDCIQQLLVQANTREARRA